MSSVGSAFTGVGGFDLALERAGWTVRWQIENDKWCQQVLRARWPDTPLYGDVRDVEGADLASVDLLCGGFPCQGVSVAGHREGLADERSALFHEFIRLARAVAPRWLLLENVPGLLSSQDGEDFATVIGELSGWHPAVPDGGWRNAGVCVGPRGCAAWRVLDSKYFGVPQRRRRVFVVVDTAGSRSPEVLLEPDSVPGHPAPGREEGPGASGKPASGTFPALRGFGHGWQGQHNDDVAKAMAGMDEPAETLDASYYKGPGNVWGKERQMVTSRPLAFNWQNWSNDGLAVTDDGSSPLDTSQVKAVVPAPRSIQNARATNPGQDGVGVAEEGDPAYTLTGRDDPGVTYPVPRRLTPVECERLQGFPDQWTAAGLTEEGAPTKISDTQRYKQMGNAVTVPVVEWIGRRVNASLADALDG